MSRILDAGGIAGSAKNRRPWRFLALGDRGLVDQVAQTVYAPPYLLAAPGGDRNCGQRRGRVAFDPGRAAQRMMLAAWNEGVVCCPNGIASPDSMAELFGLEADEQVQIVLWFGYPACTGPGSPLSRGVDSAGLPLEVSRVTCRGARAGDGPVRGPGRAGPRRA